MVKNKPTMNIALLLVCVGAAVGAIAIADTAGQNDVFLSTSSPKGTYTVSLTGREDRPKVPFVSNEVFFSVSKDGKIFLTNKFVHSGDWFDPSFDLLYPQHHWVREDVLQFYREEFFSEAGRESIVVQNKTQNVVKYLRVTSVDSFLLFDVLQGASSTLIISAPRGDNRWITVEGEFAEGRRIRETGVGFVFPKSRKGPFAYYVYINEDGLKIESPDLEKYKGTN